MEGKEGELLSRRELAGSWKLIWSHPGKMALMGSPTWRRSWTTGEPLPGAWKVGRIGDYGKQTLMTISDDDNENNDFNIQLINDNNNFPTTIMIPTYQRQEQPACSSRRRGWRFAWTGKETEIHSIIPLLWIIGNQPDYLWIILFVFSFH